VPELGAIFAGRRGALMLLFFYKYKCTQLRRKMTLKVDLSGKKFHSLTAIEEVKERKRRRGVLWKFKCDCGKETIHEGYRVKSGEIKSCGCSRKRIKNNTDKFKRKSFSDYIYRANKKKIEFKLLYEEFDELISSNCFYCNSSPEFRDRKYAYSAYVNGIDRIDSNSGYVKSNVVSCCKHCNIAKNSLSQDEFLKLITKIYENVILSNEIKN
jgi:hypothetical protein